MYDHAEMWNDLMALVAGEVAELAWVADEFKRTRQDMDKNKNLVGDQQACKILKHSSVLWTLHYTVKCQD